MPRTPACMIDLRLKDDLSGCRAKVLFEDGVRMKGVIGAASIVFEIRGQPTGSVATGRPVVIELGHRDGLYRFPSRLTRKDGQSLWFAWPESRDIQHEQRRAYYRVTVDLPAILRVGNVESGARVIDLSGGGARIHAGAAPPIGTTVELVFDLLGRPLSAGGHVVRWVEDEEGGFAIAFEHLKAEVQDRIVGFTFARQVQAAKRTDDPEAARLAAELGPRPRPAPAPAPAAEAPKPRPVLEPPPEGQLQRDQELIERTRKLIQRLPAGLPPEVQRQLVYASLEAFDVQPRRLAESLQRYRRSLDEQQESAERECQVVTAQQSVRIAELEEQAARLRLRLAEEAQLRQGEGDHVLEQRRVAEELQALLGPEAVARAAAASVRLKAPQAVELNAKDVRVLDQVQRLLQGLPQQMKAQVLTVSLSAFDIPVEWVLECAALRLRALDRDRERAQRAAARQEEESATQLRAMEQEIRLAQEVIQAQTATTAAVRESSRQRQGDMQSLSDLLCIEQLL